MANRALSAALRRQLFKPFREKDIRILLIVDHSEFAEPFRFASGDPNEFATITSNGEDFIVFPFEIALLDDDGGEPEAVIRIQNVDDQIGSTLLSLPDEAVSVTIQGIMRETPDVIEYEATNLELVDVVVTAIEVSGRLRIRGLQTEPCPGRVMTARISPVFFR